MNAAFLCVMASGESGFEQHYLIADVLHTLSHESVAAPDVEHRSKRRILLHSLKNACIAVPEPERNVFHAEASFIAPVGVRNRRRRLASPVPFLGLLEIS